MSTIISAGVGIVVDTPMAMIPNQTLSSKFSFSLFVYFFAT